MLRDYQQVHIDMTMDSLHRHDSVISVAPCGSGKTVMISHIIKHEISKLGINTVLIIVHRDYLITQISLTLSKSGIVHSIYAPNKTIGNVIHENNMAGTLGFIHANSPIRILSVASYKSYATRIHESELIITDEGHHDNGKNIWSKVREVAGVHKFLAFTATPIRSDNTDLSTIYDDLVETITIKELIDKHYLAPFRVFAPAHIDMSKLKVGSTGDYTESSVEQSNIPLQIASDILKVYKEKCLGDRVLAYCNSIKSCERFKAMFDNEGYSTAILHSKLKDNVRKEYLNGFKAGKYKIIFTVSILSEGFDLPELNTVFLLNPTKSYSKFIQEFTRCLRPHRDKLFANIYDFVGVVQTIENPNGLTIPTNYGRWALYRDDIAPNKKVEYIDKVCTSCLGLVPPRTKICPLCNEKQDSFAVEHSEKEIYIVDGELVEISQDSCTEALIELAKRIKPLKHVPSKVPSYVQVKIKKDNIELIKLLTSLKILLNSMKIKNISYNDVIIWTNTDLLTIVKGSKTDLKTNIALIQKGLDRHDTHLRD